MSTWYVYIVLTEKSHFYTGITTDLARRLQEHKDVNQGRSGAKGAKYFRTQKPLTLVYSRCFANRAEASRHEREIKKLSRVQKNQLVNDKKSGGIMRFHYLQHAEGEDIGNMREWFETQGWLVSSTQLHKGESLPPGDSFDWLGIMGGPMSAYDDAIYSWLAEEKRFIRTAIEAGKVVIGICLGSQLLADVLGARVYKAPQQEIGWFEIKKQKKLQDTPVALWLPERSRFLCWHGDTFDLPSGAVPLASSACTPNQGFLWGTNVVALQFHLEAAGGTPEAFADAEGHAPEPGPFVQEWSEVVGNEVLYVGSRAVMHQLLDHLQNKIRIADSSN